MSSYISKTAKIDNNVQIGYNAIIEENVVIKKSTIIGNNVIIKKGSIIGENCTISDNSIIGKSPLKAKNSATTETKTFSPITLGNNVIVGACCILYKGTKISNDVFIGDLTSIREDVEIGENTIIGKGATIENKSRIGKYVKIETEAYITAISTIEDYCFIAPGVTFTNDQFLGRTEKRKTLFKGPVVKKGARIGANATILPGKIIGEDALVGAGSVVTKNLEPKKIYVGVPAKEIRNVPKEELLENQTYFHP
ncbi:N-acetyltransferase [Petrotoga halophila]|uniref:UDP-3-O-(3-hydroxymyristoyl) glucosamine N-acyltransferase n=1 Tax=Petrotoga halophila DSM 16923 TaxID=1122953 RepID=A0A2S5EHE0_9BACT|nr:N-acetyltransferase [Petrotoga halophila]POZ92562.1 UDP-3-O-(3-hydroxymyristoyl) glucosamine N-acyltransferase [Petrotoga halophila DSM 16923]